MSAGTEFGYR